MAVGTPNAPRAAGAVRAWEVANEEAKAEAGDEGPLCQAGHAMHRRETGAAGLTCEGGCGRALRRGTKRW